MYAYPDDRLPLPEVHAPQRRKADHEPKSKQKLKKKNHKHAQPPNKNNKIRPSGGGELGEGGGQSERTVINWLAKARLFIVTRG